MCVCVNACLSDITFFFSFRRRAWTTEPHYSFGGSDSIKSRILLLECLFAMLLFVLMDAIHHKLMWQLSHFELACLFLLLRTDKMNAKFNQINLCLWGEKKRKCWRAPGGASKVHTCKHHCNSRSF